MTPTCGHRWNAPHQTPPTALRGPKLVYREQVCILPADHQGEHRSNTNCTQTRLPEGFA